MPIGPIKTKAQKQGVVHQELHKFKEGTLHSGSKHGPVVKNRKQAIAIALSESGQSKKKPGAKYDRSGHFPGNPGFNREGKPHYDRYDAGARAAQPGGKSIGSAPEFTAHTSNQSFQAEQREHGGRGGGDMAKKRPQMAYGSSGKGSDHSTLREQDNGPTARQPGGKSIGYHDSGPHGAEHHAGHSMGGAKAEPHKFDRPPSQQAHGYGHAAHVRSGHLRMSGHSGAHRVGKR